MKCVALVVLMALVAANAQVIVPSASVYPGVYPYGVSSLYRGWNSWNTLTNGAYHPLQGARLAFDSVAYDGPAVYPGVYPGFPSVYPGVPGAYSPPIVVDSTAKTTVKSYPGLTVLKAEAPEVE